MWTIQNYSRNISCLQKQLAQAIAAAIAKVAGALMGKYAGRMDFAKVSALAKKMLGG